MKNKRCFWINWQLQLPPHTVCKYISNRLKNSQRCYSKSSSESKILPAIATGIELKKIYIQVQSHFNYARWSRLLWRESTEQTPQTHLLNLIYWAWSGDSQTMSFLLFAMTWLSVEVSWSSLDTFMKPISTSEREEKRW